MSDEPKMPDLNSLMNMAQELQEIVSQLNSLTAAVQNQAAQIKFLHDNTLAERSSLPKEDTDYDENATVENSRSEGGPDRSESDEKTINPGTNRLA